MEQPQNSTGSQISFEYWKYVEFLYGDHP